LQRFDNLDFIIKGFRLTSSQKSLQSFRHKTQVFQFILLTKENVDILSYTAV